MGVEVEIEHEDDLYQCLLCELYFKEEELADSTARPGFFPGRDHRDKVGICIRCYFTPAPIEKVEYAFLRLPL